MIGSINNALNGISLKLGKEILVTASDENFGNSYEEYWLCTPLFEVSPCYCLKDNARYRINKYVIILRTYITLTLNNKTFSEKVREKTNVLIQKSSLSRSCQYLWYVKVVKIPNIFRLLLFRDTEDAVDRIFISLVVFKIFENVAFSKPFVFALSYQNGETTFL